MKKSPFIYILVLPVFLLSTVLLIGCFDLADSCETIVSRRLPNTEFLAQAIVIVTDCGATTSSLYAVRIIETLDTTVTGGPEQTILLSNKGVGVRWISNDTLLISGADTTNGLTMKYSQKLERVNKEIWVVYTK